MGAQHHLTPDAARGLLARGQRLDDASRSDGAAVADVVRDVVAIQAQERNAGALGVRARLDGATASAVSRAVEEDRSIVRLWCMRGTLHYVAASDAPWLMALLGPVALRKAQKRLDGLGVGGDDAERVVCDVLTEADGPLNRHEIATAARERGFELADDQQAPVHLVARASLTGHVIEAGWRGGKPVHVLWRDWLPDAPVPHDADRDLLLAELARRYLRAHPPAGPHDLAIWSGLRIAEATRAFELIAGEVDTARVLDRDVFVPREDALDVTAPAVRLLPAWDSTMLCHRDRALTVGPEVPERVVANYGVLSPVVLVQGRVLGNWKLGKGQPAIDLFAPLAGDLQAALQDEVADVMRFRAG